MRCTSPPLSGAALPVERQVLQADVAQVLQARAHLVEQQFERIVEHRAGQAQAHRKSAAGVRC
jgi:hypothetical protein